MRGTVFLGLVAAAFCASGAAPAEIVCEGTNYPWHVQGVATDGASIYWSYTTVLVKTDLAGRKLDAFSIARDEGHLGDLAWRKGKLYVGVNRERAKDGTRRGDEVWQIDPQTLAVERKHPTPETIWCNNGLDWWDGSWWVVTSSPKGFPYNLLFEYDEDFRFKTCHVVKSGWTELGVQTILTVGDRLLLGAYGKTNVVVVDAKALRRGRRDVEQDTAVERVIEKCYVAEGMLVLDGCVYGVCQTRYSKPGEMPQRWGASLVPRKPLTDLLERP